ncbi:MAG TPA: Rid family hydrolase [Candidatus Saccharimonadales bacterium]|jgi:enamine deaminase RidA (YjgF/YER057c/UK114 family)|nr:Rid family hydrolase [Candidatus Saccharimonadales bacterium]
MPDRDPNNPSRWLYSTKTKYEFQFGYSRAVRHGSVIRVAGTAGLDEDGSPVKGSIVDQTKRALDIVRAAIEDLGGRLEDTIMTRVYVADVAAIESVAVVHGDFFRDIRPATTIVQVSFIDPRIQVEIEAEAVYGGADAKQPG